ncbi:class I SAM-dependent methyltransferase [Egicoccus sp. AB-alg2]|uniref:class I SAM-dependent methyltransferase n=1 Tax=Egicoccus sp. AB-alg2 TaxID=3242693 RepID=UPI00359DC1D1
MDEHARTNLANWEARTPIHAASEAYGLQRYVDDPSRLSDVVAHDAPFLGDLTGLRVVHLQCHIGTDTLSLARLGGEVTGVDFSPSAIAVARDLAERAGPPVRYVQASVDEVPEALPETFDVVYTGVGALNWLPSVSRWARIVAGLLAPGGRLYLREGHPMLNALDDERDDELLVVAHPYFEQPAPTEWVTPTTYTGDDTPVSAPVTREWAHGLGETVQAVLDAGLRLTRLAEHAELEWAFFDWMRRNEAGRYELPNGRERLPLMYTLEAVRTRDHAG